MSYYSSLILTESPPPTAYYRLSEVSGNIAHDSTPNGYDATLSGGFTLGQAGAISNDADTSCVFTGTGSLTLPPALNYTTFTAISIEFWINLTGTWHYIVASNNGTTTTVYYDSVLSSTSSGASIEISSVFDYAGSYLTANLDEVVVYNYVLSQTQINNHFAAATVANAGSATQGGIRLLINNVYYPTIIQDTINIDRTTNDPIPTFRFKLQDDPSQIPLSELLEVIFIDAGRVSNATHNLIRNPLINPFATNWSQTAITGGTFTQMNPGVKLTVANATAASSLQLYQYIQNGLIVPGGQTYMLSCFVQTTTLTGCNAFISILYVDASGFTLGSQVQLISTTLANTQISFSSMPPTGTVATSISFGITTNSGTNSGTATFTNMQCEPMSFATGATQIAYPSPFCANGQFGCTLMPDGTTIRQYRLFGGLLTKATAGDYIGNNRKWDVTVSGYAWLWQKQLLNDAFVNKSDNFILINLVTKYFPGQFNTAQIATGATLDNFGYTFNGTMRDAADALAANSNFNVYVGPYREIIYQPPGYNQIGFMLSDRPDNILSFPYYSYSLDIDGTQLGNACLVTGGTNISAVEYDPQSIGFYNQKTGGQGIFWRTVNDSTIATTAAARQRAIAEITQYNYARKVAHLTTNQMMIPGYTVLFSSNTDGLFDVPFLIQKSTLVLKGFTSLQTPYYECSCNLGAFNPDLVNITVKLLRKQLTNANNIGTPIVGLMSTEEMTFVDQIKITVVHASPATYSMGTYGVSTYAVSVPGIPPTTYGTGVYGDLSHGYQ